jgi:hypothetical protein
MLRWNQKNVNGVRMLDMKTVRMMGKIYGAINTKRGVNMQYGDVDYNANRTYTRNSWLQNN